MKHVSFDKGLHGLCEVDIYPPHMWDTRKYKNPLCPTSEPPSASHIRTGKHWYLAIYDANDNRVADGFTTHRNPKRALAYLMDLVLVATQGEVE